MVGRKVRHGYRVDFEHERYYHRAAAGKIVRGGGTDAVFNNIPDHGGGESDPKGILIHGIFKASCLRAHQDGNERIVCRQPE